jgi:Ca2+-binding RTX toxin-like protein
VDTGITNENIDAALAVGAIDIYGNDGGNDLIGNSSNNLISGGDGDDTITGGDGDDVLTGGNGIDTFVFSDDGTGNNISITDWGVEAGDVLSGALSAGDVLDVTFGASGATVNPAPAVTPGNLGLDGAVIFDATYDVGDQITLTVGGQVLNHTVALGATSGNAVVADFVNTMNNIIDLELNTGDMDLGSLAGSASVDGGNPNKLIITNDNTGDGAFTVTAATVNSNSVTFDASGIAATNGTVDVTGGGTDDIITGGAGDDTIDGLMGADVINGGDGADIITGDGGIDTIDGGDGADNIDGGYGGDDLTGGAGDDTFTYTKDTHDGDTIHDFNTAGDDHFAFDADASDLFRSAITGGNLHIITGVAGGSALLQTAGTAGSVALANLFGGTTGFANKAAFLSALTGITNGVAINSEYFAFALSTGGSNLWVAQASESIGINTNDIDSASVIMTIGINSSANVQAADIVII